MNIQWQKKKKNNNFKSYAKNLKTKTMLSSKSLKKQVNGNGKMKMLTNKYLEKVYCTCRAQILPGSPKFEKQKLGIGKGPKTRKTLLRTIAEG